MSGRCQILQEEPYIIVDVAHNPDSVAALSQFIASREFVLDERTNAKKIAVVSMLDDKDINSSLNEISGEIDEWHVAELNIVRAASKEKIVNAIQTNQKNAKIYQHAKLTIAFDVAKKSLKSKDCLLVFGSFFAVSDILRHYQK